MSEELKLYVWEEFCPDYSDGLAVAIASTMEEAQEEVQKILGFTAYEWGPVQVFPIGKKAFCVTGGS